MLAPLQTLAAVDPTSTKATPTKNQGKQSKEESPKEKRPKRGS
jgi:hypothetical protein